MMPIKSSASKILSVFRWAVVYDQNYPRLVTKMLGPSSVLILLVRVLCYIFPVKICCVIYYRPWYVEVLLAVKIVD